MSHIKQRPLTYQLNSHPDLRVGDCVPFYFCPRSVMLYVLHMASSPELDYRGGQGPIVHLEADLHEAVAWADRNQRRWVFTLSNAGSGYFKDRCDLAELGEIDWEAVQARNWQGRTHGKQAEFLMEQSFPWTLFRRVGVRTSRVQDQAREAMRTTDHQPAVELRREWYY